MYRRPSWKKNYWCTVDLVVWRVLPFHAILACRGSWSLTAPRALSSITDCCNIFWYFEGNRHIHLTSHNFFQTYAVDMCGRKDLYSITTFVLKITISPSLSARQITVFVFLVVCQICLKCHFVLSINYSWFGVCQHQSISCSLILQNPCSRNDVFID